MRGPSAWVPTHPSLAQGARPSPSAHPGPPQTVGAGQLSLPWFLNSPIYLPLLAHSRFAAELVEGPPLDSHPAAIPDPGRRLLASYNIFRRPPPAFRPPRRCSRRWRTRARPSRRRRSRRGRGSGGCSATTTCRPWSARGRWSRSATSFCWVPQSRSPT